MTIYYVFQGETYDEERTGGYVWSPQLTGKYRKNAGYEMMKNIEEGDFILHNSKGKIISISVAKGNYYDAKQPSELSKAETSVKWNDEGYRVDTDYFDFDSPIVVTEYRKWLESNYEKDSAFTIKGTGKQQYMCKLAKKHAEFLLKESIKQQHSEEVCSVLEKALKSI